MRYFVTVQQVEECQINPKIFFRSDLKLNSKLKLPDFPMTDIKISKAFFANYSLNRIIFYRFLNYGIGFVSLSKGFVSLCLRWKDSKRVKMKETINWERTILGLKQKF